MRRWIEDTIRQIKRAETPGYATIKRTLQRIQRTEIPAPKGVYQGLYDVYRVQKNIRSSIERILLYQPMFRAQCASVGKHVYVYQGMPYIAGNLQMHIGDECKISAQTSLVAGHTYDAPTLTLGHHTNIGPGVVISVSQAVTLGNHVRISTGVMICDNPGHPIDPVERRHQAVHAKDIKPVTIEDDVWIGTNAMIMPGVHIGKGSIVAAGSIVTRDVEPFTVVGGAPATCLRRLHKTPPIPSTPHHPLRPSNG